MSATELDVVCIGNAIVDVMTRCSEQTIADMGLERGAMTLIDAAQAESLYTSMGPTLETSGGSACNTAAGVASFGGSVGYVGKVRDDQLGEIFSHDIRSIGAVFETPAAKHGPPTARCFIFVTPDGQRTMNTYLGACVGLGPDDIDSTLVERAKLTYLEGYLWDPDEAKQAFLKAARLAHVAGRQVALALSDAFCVDRHRASFLELVNNHVDVLFANEEELLSLYETSSFDEAARAVRGGAAAHLDHVRAPPASGAGVAQRGRAAEEHLVADAADERAEVRGEDVHAEALRVGGAGHDARVGSRARVCLLLQTPRWRASCVQLFLIPLFDSLIY